MDSAHPVTQSLTHCSDLSGAVSHAGSLFKELCPPLPPLPTVMDSPPTLPSTDPTSAKVESGAPPSQMAPMPSPLPSDMESLPSPCPHVQRSQPVRYVHTSRRRTDRHRHIHTRLLSLPQSRALLLHIKSMLSHSREVDGRAIPMKKHFLCKLESHNSPPIENQDLGNGYGKNSKSTTGRTPPPHSWPLASGRLVQRRPPLPSGPTNTHRAASYLLCFQVPPAFDGPSGHPRPSGETTEQLALNHSSTFLGYLKSCPRPFTGSR